MTQSRDRILTSHVGSLPRPKPLLDMMKARLTGEGDIPDDATYDKALSEAVRDIVAKQAECGIDIVSRQARSL